MDIASLTADILDLHSQKAQLLLIDKEFKATKVKAQALAKRCHKHRMRAEVLAVQLQGAEAALASAEAAKKGLENALSVERSQNKSLQGRIALHKEEKRSLRASHEDEMVSIKFLEKKEYQVEILKNSFSEYEKKTVKLFF